MIMEKQIIELLLKFLKNNKNILDIYKMMLMKF